ncbi:hypothetical protein PPEP_a3867 [Pseudoalteromonas peptidolytica F12-50-A1]|uniref:Uncharacterized protein n=1 Tax=Pseudoalteromonas peptidolytica F12-50-A1 TaxID=1315280 RepID=A0A8I0MWH1_9GAMM|nr:hypothetical protein [Pseudoalteromonas peptidolytica F12-50-A1]
MGQQASLMRYKPEDYLNALYLTFFLRTAKIKSPMTKHWALGQV